MSPSLPLLAPSFPADLRRRLEIAEATAREAILATHAAEARRFVSLLASRVPFDEAVQRYIEVMGLRGDMEEIVRDRAFVALSGVDAETDLARNQPRFGGLNWRYATPLGAVRFVQRQLRRSAEEDLLLEIAAAVAEEALAETHVDHALLFVDLMGRHAPPPRGVSLYLDRMEVPAARARGIYQRTLAALAPEILPRSTEITPPRQPPSPTGTEPVGRSRRALQQQESSSTAAEHTAVTGSTDSAS